jgi:hypothetical protein
MSARLNDAEWLRRQLGPDKSPSEGGAAGCDAGQNRAARGGIGSQENQLAAGFSESVEPPADGLTPGQGLAGIRPGRLGRRAVMWCGGLTAVGVVVALLCSTLVYGGHQQGGQARNDPPAQQSTIESTAAPTPDAFETAGVDRPLPFTASADCPAGSTSAQTLAGADPTNAFVCVRKLIDGQTIQIDLSKSYVITAISITPGWLGKDSSGTSQWAQHRVVTRVQYIFNDTDRTVVVQNTGNVHGEAVQPVKHVLASKLTVLILQTSRPPAETTTPVPVPGLGPPGGGLFADPDTTSPSPSLPPILGTGNQTTTDPVDATFAISHLKIIGHEAI